MARDVENTKLFNQEEKTSYLYINEIIYWHFIYLNVIIVVIAINVFNTIHLDHTGIPGQTWLYIYIPINPDVQSST